MHTYHLQCRLSKYLKHNTYNKDVMKNAFQFHGRGGEYFGIWIVNILLTIVTFGLYSPWAHVRNKKYFYGNTELAGERFEYLATGKQIFLGRLIAGVLFIAFSILYQTMFVVSMFILVFMMLLYPWVVQRSLRFNAVMTRYRGVRFGFNGSVKDAYVGFLGKPIVAYIIGGLWAGLAYLIVNGFTVKPLKDPNISAGQGVALLIWMLGFVAICMLLLAWVKKGIAAYIHNGYMYGDQKFQAPLSTVQYMKNYWLALFTVLGFVVLASVILGVMGVFTFGKSGEAASPMALVFGLVTLVFYIGLFVLMLFINALIFSKIRNYTYGQTQIGAERAYAFESNIMPSDYMVLLFTNSLMVTFSLGFLTPFVRVRVAEFLAKHTSITGDLNALVSQEQAQVKTGATADALGDVFNLDIQF